MLDIRQDDRGKYPPLMFFITTNIMYLGVMALPTEPAWCANLRKQPKVSWQVKRSIFEGHARELPDNAKERSMEKGSEIYPGYARYKERLARPIAIFELGLQLTCSLVLALKSAQTSGSNCGTIQDRS